MKLFKRLCLTLITSVLAFSCVTSAVAARPGGVGLTLFADPLGAVAMVNAPNSLFYVAQLGGKIRVLNNNGTLRPQPAIDLADPQFSCRWLGQMQTMPMVSLSEGGLLNIAVDPNFDTNLRLYFYYTTAKALVLARMRFEPTNQDELVPSSCEVILQLPYTAQNHLGGSLVFGLDGFLNLGFGNNHRLGCEQITSPSQATQFGLNCTSASALGGVTFNPNAGFFFGKIIRIDINSESPAGHSLCGVPNNMPALYQAPSENSFGPSDKCPEIFAYGLRNPWRMNIDRSTGDLTIGDVGEDRFEELDILKRGGGSSITSGANLGWPCFEALAPYDSTGACLSVVLNATHQPVMIFPGTKNFYTVIGGYRYRGPSSQFNGFYLGADGWSKQVVIAESTAAAPIGQPQTAWTYVARSGLQLFNTTTALVYPVSLAQDNFGNVYLLDNGSIFRFTFNADVEFQSRFE